MKHTITLLNIQPLDIIAFIFFITVWVGYTWYTDHSHFRRRSISMAMAHNRHRWMLQALKRDNRITDTGILNNLITGVAFFASTTILVLGALMATLGSTTDIGAAISNIVFAQPTTTAFLETKIILLILIFIYAFFKFTWAFRLANYCSIMVGALPASGDDAPERYHQAARAAKMSMLSSHHFNRGIRAYFFALAALMWFLHPALFMLATTNVCIVLYRREFKSRAHGVASSTRDIHRNLHGPL
jgi:uncharacterized membrane protein